MKLEVLVDFVDDVLMARQPITEANIISMCEQFAERGVSRLIWAYYADDRGGFHAPSGYDAGRHKWSNYAQVYAAGRNPVAEAAKAAHRHGQELYAYFKPYETGPNIVFPAGSPEAEQWGIIDHGGGKLAWLDPFVIDNPHLRIRHRDAPVPADLEASITKIKLIKRDDSPTRLRKEHIEIWTSKANYRYEKSDLDFAFTETVEAAESDVKTGDDTVVTPKGAPIRVLTLSGLDIHAPYVLVTTNFTDGPADFGNVATEMMRPYDNDGREIIGVFASGAGIYLRDHADFRNWGVMFDPGLQREVVHLDSDSSTCKSGFIAFTRGRNQYLSGALCETEPQVQEHWLDCLGSILDAGADGVEFRIENHSTHTSYPEEYGFNPAVLEQCQKTGFDVATVRGNAYTEFLHQAKELIAARRKRMRINLNVDWFGDDRPPQRRLAYPANIDFQWQRWIDEKLLDEATLRSYFRRENVLNDSFAREITDRCKGAGIPIAFNHHIFRDEAWFLDEYRRVKADGRFDSCILYEANTFTEYRDPVNCEITMNIINDICKDAENE